MVNKTFWISYAAGVIVTAGSIYWGIRNASAVMAPDVTLSELKLTDLQGQPVNTRDFHGKPLVVNYWATWCKPCIAEFPGFEKLKQEYAGQVSFVMISDEDAAKVSRFKAKNNYSFNFVLSELSFQELGMNMVPVTFVYDAGGELIRKQAGSMEEAELKEWIEEAVR